MHLDEDGGLLRDQATIDRLKALAIPPAWTDVWICPDPRGHIQATGVDVKGRRQYRYHDEWRKARDRRKHERVVEFAKELPRLRRRVTADLRRPEPDKRRVLAAACRLLERGLFRVGGEAYTEDNGSFGLATTRKEHVGLRQGRVVFDYPAKSGQRRVVEIDDPALARVIGPLKRRRSGGPDLLAYRDHDGQWVDVRSDDINEYLREVLGPDFSSKDFRTWAGTVRAAVALAEGHDGPQAVRRVAEELGNTPAVARASYIDPRIVEQAADGATVEPDEPDVESQVIELLDET